MSTVDVLLSIFIGVTTGAIASYVFLNFYLKNKIPIIVLAEEIAKKEFQGEMNYFFKFVNKTDCEIFDVKVELTLYKPIGARKGYHLQGEDIELKDDFFSYISTNVKNDERNLHAVQPRTTIDIEKNLKEGASFLRLTVIAKHSLSGLNKVYFKDYNSKDLIIKGSFNSGDNTSIYTNNH